MSTRLKVLVDEFVSMGTNMEDSIRLAKEQIELERKERIEARELQKQEAEFELLKKKQEAKEARLERDRLERIERDKLKQEAEEARLERNRVDQLELQRSKLEHEQNIEKSRLEHQRLVAESDSQIRLHEIDNRSRVLDDRSGASGDGNNFRKYDLGI